MFSAKIVNATLINCRDSSKKQGLKPRQFNPPSQISRSNKEGFLATCRGVFAAKVSGTLCRKTLAKGKKAVAAIDTLIKLASRETSLSALVTSVVQCLPARPAFATRAAVDESGGKYLNEDDDPRTVSDVSSYFALTSEFVFGASP